MNENRERTQTFTEDDMPDLDVVVRAALELFATTTLPSIDTTQHARPLVVGSVNAYQTGKILFADTNAVFADENNYAEKIAAGGIDAVYLFSASGKKHAVEIAQAAADAGLPRYLITNTENAEAAPYFEPENVQVFPKNREPYTYNTSTYLGMILGATGEDPEEIHRCITTQVAPLIPDNLTAYRAFTLVVPKAFADITPMFVTKFDELFGPMLVGRSFTDEEMKHAKTVIQSDEECFIYFGTAAGAEVTAENNLHIPLPEPAEAGAVLAIGYYVIGHIQKQFPPYFKEHIAAYTERAGAAFGQSIAQIVE